MKGGSKYIPSEACDEEGHCDRGVRRHTGAARLAFAEEVANSIYPTGFHVSARTSNKRKKEDTDLTAVATLSANGAWNVVEDDTKSTDCVASATGPSLEPTK